MADATGLTASEFADWVTGIGIILGLIGGFWKWFLQDSIRRRTDYLKLDGIAGSRVEGEMSDAQLVRVFCVWRNVGERKIEIEPEKSKIFIYDADDFEEFGAVDPATERKLAIHEAIPYSGSSSVFFEARTESEFSAIFKLARGKAYLARVWLEAKPGPHAPEGTFWARRLAFSTLELPKVPSVQGNTINHSVT